MKKKYTSALLSLILLTSSLSGCKDDKPDNDSPSQEVEEKLATPSNVSIVGNSLTWNSVANAKEYVVQIANKEYRVTTNSFDLSSLSLADGTILKVKAVADNYKDSEFSLSVKYESGSAAKGQLELLKGIMTSSFGIDLSNPQNLLKYQAALTSLASTLATINLTEADITNVVAFSENAARVLQDEDASVDEITNLLFEVLDSFAKSKVSSTSLLSICKDVLSMVVTNYASENFAPNNAIGIKLNMVANYLVRMNNADLSKIGVLVDFVKNVYNDLSTKVASLTPEASFFDIKDMVVGSLQDNAPSYTQVKEAGNAIYNILLPFETDSNSLKKVVDYTVSSTYDELAYALYVVDSIDQEFVNSLSEDAMDILNVVSPFLGVEDYIEFAIEYSGFEDNEGKLYEGLTNLFYNFEEIAYEYSYKVYLLSGEFVIFDTEQAAYTYANEHIEEVDYVSTEQNLNSELQTALLMGGLLSVNTLCENLGVSLSSIAGLFLVEATSPLDYLSEIYETYGLSTIIPFKEGKTMVDVVSILDAEITMDDILSITCLDDVITLLGLDEIFTFTEGYQDSLKLIFADEDFYAFIDSLKTMEDPTAKDIIMAFVAKAKLDEVVTLFYSKIEGFLNTNFDVNDYPEFVSGVVSHLLEDYLEIMESITSIGETLEAKYTSIVNGYTSVVDDVEIPTNEDYASISLEFNKVFMTQAERNLVNNITSAASDLEVLLDDEIARYTVLAEKYEQFATIFDGKSKEDILYMIMDEDPASDILDDYYPLLSETIDALYETLDNFNETFPVEKLNNLNATLAEFIASYAGDDVAIQFESNASALIEEYEAIVLLLPSLKEDAALTVQEFIKDARHATNEIVNAADIIINKEIQIISTFDVPNFVVTTLEDFFKIECPQGFDGAITSLEELQEAYKDEEYKQAFKAFVKEKYDYLLGKAKLLANLDDTAVETLNKYFFDTIVDDEGNEDPVYYISDIERNILAALEESSTEDGFNNFYAFLEKEILVGPEPPTVEIL